MWTILISEGKLIVRVGYLQVYTLICIYRNNEIGKYINLLYQYVEETHISFSLWICFYLEKRCSFKREKIY